MDLQVTATGHGRVWPRKVNVAFRRPSLRHPSVTAQEGPMTIIHITLSIKTLTRS